MKKSTNKPTEKNQESKWEQDIEWLKNDSILMPKMYDFGEVREIVKEVSRQAKIEAWEEAKNIVSDVTLGADECIVKFDQAISRLKNNEKV